MWNNDSARADVLGLGAKPVATSAVTGEPHTLSALGITSINAVPTVAVVNDNGNLVTLESTYTYTTSSGQTGVIVQVRFAYGGPNTTVPTNDDYANAA